MKVTVSVDHANDMHGTGRRYTETMTCEVLAVPRIGETLVLKDGWDFPVRKVIHSPRWDINESANVHLVVGEVD